MSIPEIEPRFWTDDQAAEFLHERNALRDLLERVTRHCFPHVTELPQTLRRMDPIWQEVARRLYGGA
jgi:hypothetical protein